MSHIYRDDFPSLDEVTVNFITCPSEGAALAKEAELIAQMGITAQGGPLVNKVRPSRIAPATQGLGSIGKAPPLAARLAANDSDRKVIVSLREIAARFGIGIEGARAKAKRRAAKGVWRILPQDHPADPLQVEMQESEYEMGLASRYTP